MHDPKLFTLNSNLDLSWAEASGQELAAAGEPALGCGELRQLDVSTASVKGYKPPRTHRRQSD